MPEPSQDASTSANDVFLSTILQHRSLMRADRPRAGLRYLQAALHQKALSELPGYLAGLHVEIAGAQFVLGEDEQCTLSVSLATGLLGRAPPGQAVARKLNIEGMERRRNARRAFSSGDVLTARAESGAALRCFSESAAVSTLISSKADLLNASVNGEYTAGLVDYFEGCRQRTFEMRSLRILRAALDVPDEIRWGVGTDVAYLALAHCASSIKLQPVDLMHMLSSVEKRKAQDFFGAGAMGWAKFLELRLESMYLHPDPSIGIYRKAATARLAATLMLSEPHSSSLVEARALRNHMCYVALVLRDAEHAEGVQESA